MLLYVLFISTYLFLKSVDAATGAPKAELPESQTLPVLAATPASQSTIIESASTKLTMPTPFPGGQRPLVAEPRDPDTGNELADSKTDADSGDSEHCSITVGTMRRECIQDSVHGDRQARQRLASAASEARDGRASTCPETPPTPALALTSTSAPTSTSTPMTSVVKHPQPAVAASRLKTRPVEPKFVES
ncbi:hypothetical protein VTI74DRAFT_11392 [Chaetomium olivicolor]